MRSARLVWPVFAVSCGLLAFEIALMRILLYASWYHFAFLVISVVLLGFGASGTILCFALKRLSPASDRWMLGLSLAAAISMPVSLQLIQYVPVGARFVPALLINSFLYWTLFWAILFVPFCLGASAIGLALMRARAGVAGVYAANLIGSAVGAAAVTVAMGMAAPEWLGVWAGAATLLGTIPFLTSRVRRVVWLTSCASVAISMFILPPGIRTDPYKYISYVHRLQAGGRAVRIATAYGTRATVEVFEGNAFHDLPFLGGSEPPPAMMSVVVDGHGAGSILRVDNSEDAAIVDNTLMATPYSLAPERPRVLLLGETGGANIWLAIRNAAATIDVVQPNPDVTKLLRRFGGTVLAQPAVAVHREEPRDFVDRSRGEYDLIQMTSLESWAVETGGVAGLRQDYLVTVEGIARCLDRLSAVGVLAVGRGMQLPPRDNVKLLGTIVAALHHNGVDDADGRIMIVRDYLAACILVRGSPWGESDIAAIRELCYQRELTPVYFPGVRGDELNRPDRLPGPTGGTGDWLHYATTQLLSANADDFMKNWAFDIRPATDDRPFFANFTKLRSIGLLRRAFGDQWLTHTEISLLFVLVAMLVVAVVGALLTVVPLGFVRDIRHSGRLLETATYFASIGVAYLMLEMTVLSRLVHLIGDPVRAGAVTISGFLFFSGLGSLLARRISLRGLVPTRIIIGIVALGLTEATLFGWTMPSITAASASARLGVAVLFIAPVGFLMGFPMAMALRRLDDTTPALIPWAWGVNGFASVLAPPLATAIAMTAGFRIAGVSALMFYVVAALAYTRLRRD